MNSFLASSVNGGGSTRTVGSILESLPSSTSRPGTAASRPGTGATSHLSFTGSSSRPPTAPNSRGYAVSSYRAGSAQHGRPPLPSGSRPHTASSLLSSSRDDNAGRPRCARAARRLTAALTVAERESTISGINDVDTRARHMQLYTPQAHPPAKSPPPTAPRAVMLESSHDAEELASISTFKYTKDAPVNARLFCYLLMQSNNSLFSEITRVGERAFMSKMLACCRRLGMRAVGMSDFFFLLNSTLDGFAVPKREAMYIFVFLDVSGQGVLEFREFANSLRVLFKSQDTVAALCCKRFLATKRLDESLVTIGETVRMLDALVALFPSAHTLASSCDDAKRELLEMSVNYTLPAPTVSATLQRNATVVLYLNHLNWDGTLVSMEKPIGPFRTLLLRDMEQSRLNTSTAAASKGEGDSSTGGRHGKRSSAGRKRLTPRRMDRNKELLDHVYDVYHQGVAAGAAVAAEGSGACATAPFRRSSVRSRSVSVGGGVAVVPAADGGGSITPGVGLENIIDPTHPRFVADQYIDRSRNFEGRS